MKTVLRVRSDSEGERVDDRTGQLVKWRKLDLIDLSKPNFVAALSFSMRKEDAAKYPVGSLDGKDVEFGVADIVSYDKSAVRSLKGVILSVQK